MRTPLPVDCCASRYLFLFSLYLSINVLIDESEYHMVTFIATGHKLMKFALESRSIFLLSLDQRPALHPEIAKQGTDIHLRDCSCAHVKRASRPAPALPRPGSS